MSIQLLTDVLLHLHINCAMVGASQHEDMRAITIIQGVGRRRKLHVVQAPTEYRPASIPEAQLCAAKHFRCGLNPVWFVEISCVHRSPNPSQRALIAIGFFDYEREPVKFRMTGSKVKGKESFPDPIERSQSRDKAGERMGISGRRVASADREMVTQCSLKSAVPNKENESRRNEGAPMLFA